MKKLFLTVTLLAASTAVFAADSKKTFSAQGITSVYVRADAGSVKVTGIPTNAITVEEITDRQTPGMVKIEKTGDTLVVSASVKTGQSKGTKTSFKITMPQNMALTARAESGSLEINNITGMINARTDSGNMTGSTAAEDIILATDSGDIKFTGLKGRLTLHTDFGSATLKWVTLPAAGIISLNTDSGDIVAGLPSNAAFRPRLHTNTGTVSNAFSTNSGVIFQALSDIGDITLQKN